MTCPNAGETAIVLKTKWLTLGPALFIYRIFVTIDVSASSVVPWGEHVFPVVPGEHEVDVALGRDFGSGYMGVARIHVEVAEGKRVYLRYHPPFQWNVKRGEIEIIH